MRVRRTNPVLSSLMNCCKSEGQRNGGDHLTFDDKESTKSHGLESPRQGKNNNQKEEERWKKNKDNNMNNNTTDK